MISGIRIPEREFYSRSHDTVIRVYDQAGNVIDTHEHKGEFRELVSVELSKGAANAAKRDSPFLRHNVEAQLSNPARS